MTKSTQNSIKWTCNEIRDLLLAKNKAYGDSAIEPENIFSKLDNAQAICARIDDKLSRIKNVGLDDNTEDTLDDLIGYLILLKIAREQGDSNSTTWTSCVCEHGWHNCDCDTGYVPPWSLELEKDNLGNVKDVKVKVFVSDPGDEVAPIAKNQELCDNE